MKTFLKELDYSIHIFLLFVLHNLPHKMSEYVCAQTGATALKTELQFSDMYCLMAAHVYVDLWKETGQYPLQMYCRPALLPSIWPFRLFIL